MMTTRPLITLRRMTAALLLLVTVGACASMRRTGTPEPASLIFRNQSLNQATVYLVGPTTDFRRLGTVFAGQTDTLTVPANLALGGTFNIVARLLARSDVPQSGPVSIVPGQQYQVTLPINANLISFLPAGP